MHAFRNVSSSPGTWLYSALLPKSDAHHHVLQGPAVGQIPLLSLSNVLLNTQRTDQLSSQPEPPVYINNYLMI
jgi:hypothetical protein